MTAPEATALIHRDVAAAGVPISPYSHVVFDAHYAYLSGQLAYDPAAGRVVPGTIEEETRRAMDLLGLVLRAIDLDFADILKVSIFMTDLALLGRMNAVYRGYFPAGRLPARTCVGAAALIGGGQIEIDCVARRHG